MYSSNFTTNSTAKQNAYGLQYAEDYSANGSNVRLPAISKFGCVRNHSTGEYQEVVSRKLDRPAKTVKGAQKRFAALAAREAKRQAARDEMYWG